jgi:hypothetical protein
MHPLVPDLVTLKNADIEAKINDLTKKYFMTSNYGVQNQISSILDVYKEELATRQRTEWQNAVETRNKGLDKLINVS